DSEKRQRAKQGAGMEKFEFAELPDFARCPCEQRGDGREREDNCVSRAEANVEPAVWPIAVFGADAQQHVSRKKSAEEHDFGREEKPNAELGIVNAGVRSGLNCIWNVHLKNLMRVCR